MMIARSVLSAGAAFAALTVASEAIAQTGAGVGPSVVEELVVTAQRREERLQDVPIAITAIPGEQLDKSRDSLQGVLNKVPGVFSLPTPLESSISIRGVTPAGGLNAGSATVGLYLDTSPFALVRVPFVPDANVYDLDRVEVLKGPQGTLYGAASSSGVVRVLTHDADVNAFEAKVRGAASSTKGGEENYRGDVAINIPLVEGKLAVRGVLSYEDIGGFIDRPNKKNGNDGEKVTYRLKLNAQPTEELALGASIWVSKRELDSRAMGTRERTSISTRDEPELADFYIYSLNGSYDFGPATLSAAASLLRYKFLTNFNYNAFFPGLFPRSETLVTNITSKIFTQEVNLTSNGEGPWRWSAGAIYRYGDEYFFQLRESYVNNIGGTQNQDKTKSYAVFGELTRVAMDGALELTGGLRYFRDKQNTQEFSRLSQLVPVPPFANVDSTFEAVTPRVVLKYKPTSDLMTYASYSEGFRSGFAQSPVALAAAPSLRPVEPDLLKNYEIGAKGEVLNGRLSFEAAAYFIDWQDVQYQIAVVAAGVNVSASVNGESASGFGFDVGLTARPVSGLTLNVGYSRNDVTLDDDVRTGAGVLVLEKGDRLPSSPKTTLFLSADYAAPVSGNLQLRLSGSVNRTSRLHSRVLVAGVSSRVLSDAITMANASVALESDDGWTATLFVDNLFDTRDSPSRTTGPGLIPETFVRFQPRTIGVQLEKRF